MLKHAQNCTPANAHFSVRNPLSLVHILGKADLSFLLAVLLGLVLTDKSPMLDIFIIVFDCGKQVYVSVAFQTKFSHPLTSPWTPGSLCVSQQSSALPLCMHA